MGSYPPFLVLLVLFVIYTPIINQVYRAAPSFPALNNSNALDSPGDPCNLSAQFILQRKSVPCIRTVPSYLVLKSIHPLSFLPISCHSGSHLPQLTSLGLRKERPTACSVAPSCYAFGRCGFGSLLPCLSDVLRQEGTTDRPRSFLPRIAG
jgi:hypothetical protein